VHGAGQVLHDIDLARDVLEPVRLRHDDARGPGSW
jgi:hypothetical protein